MSECAPCLAYVSLPNALHAEWTRAALAAGFHVIVDKPAFTADYAEAQELVDTARRASRVLAEADVWPWHPLARSAREAADRCGPGPRAVIATFTSPAMDPGDFRYRAELGGGALLDRGSYAASCGRFFFSAEPLSVSCEILGRHGGDGVDTSFSAALRYPDGVLLGYFSIESEYQNRVEIIGASAVCSVDRVFTPAAGLRRQRPRARGKPRQPRRRSGSRRFAAFVDDVLDAIELEDHLRHSDVLLEDARVLDRLVRAAEKGTHVD